MLPTDAQELYNDGDTNELLPRDAAGNLRNLSAALDLVAIEASIAGDCGSNDLLGTVGEDIIASFESDDTLTALAGNDTLNGGLGADAMDGGLGTTGSLWTMPVKS